MRTLSSGSPEIKRLIVITVFKIKVVEDIYRLINRAKYLITHYENILCHYKGQLRKVCFRPLVSFLSLMKIVFMPVLIQSYLFRGSMVITNINLCTNFKIYTPSIPNNFILIHCTIRYAFCSY